MNFKMMWLLNKHRKLSEKRSLAYDQNKVAQVVICVMSGLALLYLMFISVGLSFAANSMDTCLPCEFFYGILPILLVVDFFFRFIWQHTPVQLVKPYMLLPIPRYTCVQGFMLANMLSSSNAIWLALTVPFALMTTVFSEGIWVAVGLVFSLHLFIVLNSQWYMLARTLINISVKWWLLPIAVYALIFAHIIFGGFDDFFDFYSSLGCGFSFGHPLYYAALLLVMAGLFEINKRVQYRCTYQETANVEQVKMKTVSEFNTLDQFGETGEYLKLEVKSVMRNKNVRKSFIFSMIFVCLLSSLISFTDIYEDSFSKAFWVVYTFVLYGAMTLIKIMSAEGNYIDGLMIHKENIMKLLQAKYYFYSFLLIVPFLLMLPTVFMEKYTLLALVAMACFSAGPVYCLLMQMAVYNRQTLPLNTKFVSKGNVETNYFQIIAELIAMFAPVMFISILKSICSETVTFIILLLVGVLFMATHRLWIRNIYRRMMKRRYHNMESFRATR